MNMKKIAAVLTAGMLVMGAMAGCGQKESAEETTGAKSEEKAEGTQETEQSETTEEEAFSHPVTTEPITISILTQRHTDTTNNAEDVWFFQYLEWWLKEEYGYNVTIDIQQTNEPEQQISLLLGTDTLPDLIWGIPLSPSNAVIYGDGQGMLLDWNEYLNETYMPNAAETLHSEERQNALQASTSINGGIYTLPKLGGRSYNTASSSIGASQDRLFVKTTWLEEAGLEMPTNIDEFYHMLEVFKNKTLESGESVIPVIGNKDYLEKAMWVMLGYYGGELSKYGTQFAIKDGKVVLPVYTEDYKTFIEIMNTMYTKGYLHQDHFTMDTTTVRGLTTAGVAGVVSDSTMASLDDYMKWECIPWFTIGDTDKIVISTGKGYSIGGTWASAAAEYPEVLALIVDYMYSPEGAMMYNYGPMKGEDPLGMVDGWYLDEKNSITTDLVVDRTYDSYTSYCYQYIYSHSTAAQDASIHADYAIKYATGEDATPTEYKIMDTITGKEFSAYERKVYDASTAQGYWFLANSKVSRPYITQVNLPEVYMTEDDTLTATEIFSVIENHIISESAKFITGARPLSELDAFQEELKGMGIEEYIALYEEAYAPFMALYFE